MIQQPVGNSDNGIHIPNIAAGDDFYVIDLFFLIFLGLSTAIPDSMTLYPIDLSRLQHIETGEFILRLLTDIDNSDIDPGTDPENSNYIAKISTASSMFNKALLQIKGRAESELLMALDEKRDRKVLTLRRALSVYEYTDDEAEKSASELIRIVMKTYKDIERMNFEAESLAIDTLVTELRNEKYSNAVALLGLTRHINAMSAANVNFRQVFDKRSSDTISTEVFNAKALRKELIGIYSDFAVYAEIMSKIKNTSYYNTILQCVNYSRKYYADIIAKRKGIV